MRKLMPFCVLTLCACPLVMGQDGEGAGSVTELAGEFRNGQVFLTWAEAGIRPESTLNVYSSGTPMASEADLRQAQVLARHIHPHSARDWWQDPASFGGDESTSSPVGFLVQEKGEPVDPTGGLFVHTVTAETRGPRFYAVTVTRPDGSEDKTLVAGSNSLTAPVTGGVEQTLPIWQGPGAMPARGAATGAKLELRLHGRGGGITAGPGKRLPNCLWFGSARHGWREGLSVRFDVSISADHVRITPSNRTWVNRAVTESWDGRDHCPAVNTWWYGYHREIHRTTDTPEAVAPNYTERQLISLVQWAQDYLGADVNRTYVSGGSMGGSGAVALALHFPDVFAAAYAQVPVYSCTRPGKGSARRLECMVGSLSDRRVVTSDGMALLDYMNGVASIGRLQGAMPPIFACNGRRDGSIPWENNPPFYQATSDARQAFAVFWNNGNHGMSREAPEDVRNWSSRIYEYRLDRSFLTFTNCSDDRDYGDGDPADGDLVGWVNRGLAWHDLVDKPDVYEVTVTAAYPGIAYPVTVDVTPRRVQHFRMAPGQTVEARVGDGAPMQLSVDDHGLVTVPGVAIQDGYGVRVILR